MKPFERVILMNLLRYFYKYRDPIVTVPKSTDMSPISIAYNSALLLTTVEPELSMKN